MAKPGQHFCYGTCEKVEFDAKNATVVAASIVKDEKCPALTAAEITTIERDVESEFKGDIETEKCTGTDCTCRYGVAPAFAGYKTITRPWTAEKTVKRRKCKYKFDVTVDVASRTVKGDCVEKPGVQHKAGKTDLPNE